MFGRNCFIFLFCVVLFSIFIHLCVLKFSYGDSIDRYSNESVFATNLTMTDLSKRNSGRKFVLALSYTEQFQNALTNFFFLVRVSRFWNATVVEPFTSHSRLYSLPSPALKGIPLSKVLDGDGMKALFTKYNLQPMVSLQEYIQTSSRQLVYIHFVYPNPYTTLQKLFENCTTEHELFDNCTTEDFVSDCDHVTSLRKDANKTLKILNDETVKKGLRDFKLSKVVCVFAGYPTSPVKIRNAITKICSNCDTASIIIPAWRGVCNSVKRGDSKRPYRLVLPNITYSQIPNFGTALPYNKYVQTLAKKFMNDSVGKHPFIVVHVRSEKLGTNCNETFDECLNRSLNIRDEILRNHSGLHVVYLTDYSIYGSQSCHDCLGKKLCQHFFSKMDIKTIQFDPVTYKTINETGFVAAVELSAMSQATYLILVGGGSFQVSYPVSDQT